MCEWSPALTAPELLVGERPPDLVDELRRAACLDLRKRCLQMLGPKPLAGFAGQPAMIRDDVDFTVVEQGALVQVGRTEGHPLVVDDRHLGVDVHGCGAALGI